MEKAGTVLKRSRALLVMFCLFLCCIEMTGCSIYNSVFKSSSDSSAANSGKNIWRMREQYVRIVKQDGISGGTVSQNDHPIMLDPGQIRSALASLEVLLSPNEKLVPVFTEPELDTLSSKLSDGLAQAGPGEDVTFVIIGQRRAVFGLAKQRKVTTGRVFYRDGKLNVIFGKIIDDVPESHDTRLNPLTPGMRGRAVSHEWILEEEPDMQFYAGRDMIRSDWVVLDLASMEARKALGMKPAKAGRVASEKPASVPESAGAPQESRQVQTPAYQTPAVTQIPQTGKASKTIEERLLMLNELKNKKLITEEEYKAKRADILKDL